MELSHLSKLSNDFWCEVLARVGELFASHPGCDWDPIYLIPDRSLFEELRLEMDGSGDSWLVVSDGGLSVVSYFRVSFDDVVDFKLVALRYAETMFRDAEGDLVARSLRDDGGKDPIGDVSSVLPKPVLRRAAGNGRHAG